MKKLLLKNHFLIATPFLVDSNFSRAVIYVHEHSEEGASGMIINKPLNINLGNVLDHLKIKNTDKKAIQAPVLMGGPVGQESGYIIYNQSASAPSTSDDVVVTTSKKILQAIADGQGPRDFIVTLGYSGWEPGQLEDEVARNDWLIAPYSYDILFTDSLEHRWRNSAALIGVDILRLSNQLGHG